MGEKMKEQCLMFCAPINAQISSQLLSYLVDPQRSGAKKLTIAMSSRGGNVNAGVTMYNQIRSMPDGNL